MRCKVLSAGVFFAVFSPCDGFLSAAGYSGMALVCSAALLAFCVSRARTAALSKSVSYTHLDVYKRQAYELAVQQGYAGSLY